MNKATCTITCVFSYKTDIFYKILWFLGYAFILFSLISCEHIKEDTYVITPDSSFNSHYFTKTWNNKVLLKGGLSRSTLYKVYDHDQAFVIRDIHHRSPEDKIREIQAQLIASEEGYGPKVLAYDVSDGKILMTFLKSYKNILSETERAKLFAKLLLKIHNGPGYQVHVSIIEQTLKKVNEPPRAYARGIMST